MNIWNFSALFGWIGLTILVLGLTIVMPWWRRAQLTDLAETIDTSLPSARNIEGRPSPQSEPVNRPVRRPARARRVQMVAKLPY